MRKRRPVFVLCLLTVLALIVAACGNSGERRGEGNGSSSVSGSDQAAEEFLEPLTVEFLTEPHALKAKREGTIKIRVKKGDELVSDADDVQFEIWREGNKEGAERFPADNEGNGIYSVTRTFQEKGSYVVIAHVTARGSHTMPQQTFIVGDGEEKNAHHEHQTAGEHKAGDRHGAAHGHHDHGEKDLLIHLQKPDTIRAKQEAMFTVHLQKNDQPLTGAKVTCEYWRDGEEKHTYLETAEIKPGEYQAKIVFHNAGNFHIKVHVKKGELHTHQEDTILVR
ncbi:FixH family protein [Bacillaceae bacterium]